GIPTRTPVAAITQREPKDPTLLDKATRDRPQVIAREPLVERVRASRTVIPGGSRRYVLAGSCFSFATDPTQAIRVTSRKKSPPRRNLGRRRRQRGRYHGAEFNLSIGRSDEGPIAPLALSACSRHQPRMQHGARV